VKDVFAGKSGLCPVCRARVEVPKPEKDVSEDTILDILGKPTSSDTVISSDSSLFEDTAISGIHKRSTPNKCCERCNQEVPAGTHICPHCHTYIATLRDF
jgi:hypothetical protein